MSTWDDKPNDYEHALLIIEELKARIEWLEEECERRDAAGYEAGCKQGYEAGIKDASNCY